MAKADSTRDTEPGDVQDRAVDGVRNLGLLANWRVLVFTLYLGMALFVYGYDKGAIAGFQAMPGFLEVFGYKTEEGTYAIAVRAIHLGEPNLGLANKNLCAVYTTEHHHVLHDLGCLSRCPVDGTNRCLPEPPPLPRLRLAHPDRRGRDHVRDDFVRRAILLQAAVRSRERGASELLHGVLAGDITSALPRPLLRHRYFLDHARNHDWHGPYRLRTQCLRDKLKMLTGPV